MAIRNITHWIGKSHEAKIRFLAKNLFCYFFFFDILFRHNCLLLVCFACLINEDDFTVNAAAAADFVIIWQTQILEIHQQYSKAIL